MTPQTWVIAILELVARLAPGALAAITGKEDDAAALEHARAELAKLPPLTPELHRLAEERRAELERSGNAATTKPGS